MRIRLKGINHVRKQLADGSWEDYWYPWKGKGAPRLPGKPGSQEFVNAYNEAVKVRVIQRNHMLEFIIDKYMSSKYFESLKPRTILKKSRTFSNIRRYFGDLPVSTLEDPNLLDVIEAWHSKIAERAPAQADYHWHQLRAMLTWATTKRLIKSNPLPPLADPYSGSRIDKIWTEQHVATFLKNAPEYLHLPFWIALWTGQREGDIVGLRWSAYDGRYLRVRRRNVNAVRSQGLLLFPSSDLSNRFLIPPRGGLRWSAWIRGSDTKSTSCLIHVADPMPGRRASARYSSVRAIRPGLSIAHFTICEGRR